MHRRSSTAGYCALPWWSGGRFSSGANVGALRCQNFGFLLAGRLANKYPEDEDDTPGAVVEAPGAGQEALQEEQGSGLRPVQRARIACQQIASAVWKVEPDLTIKQMAERDDIQRLGGAVHWEPAVVQRWLSEADPRDPSKKRGRRKRRNST